ncbi:amino acid adenylation domain-containing protein [Glutamicibacter arilaitensis]|uniref:amino acid adenylation domain-containing protein n=1 Tax=Glutamicibacter arilaitensis TaxID=256701 RepID=UPI003FCFB036
MTTSTTQAQNAEPQNTEPAEPEIIDVLPLAPLQNGLLFHALADPEALDVYTMQSTYRFAAPVDVAALRQACASLLERHPILRAGFAHEQFDTPVQFIPAAVPLPWRQLDLSADPHAGRELERLQVDERQAKFEMSRPPLIRFAYADLGSEGGALVVTNHHILIDGWSDALLVTELLRHYRAGGRDQALGEPAQFRNYLQWLAEQDEQAARGVWRDQLAGLANGTLVAPEAAERSAVLPEVVEMDLPDGLTDALIALARTARVSINTVYSLGWSLALRRLTGQDTVVFGSTVSGRPPELAGVDEMIGLFLNTVPVVTELDPHTRVDALLRQVQARQGESLQAQFVGLSTIQQDAGIGTLFDTLYVMRNTPEDDAALDRLSADTGLLEIEGGDATHYPLTFIVHPGDTYRLILAYQGEQFSAAVAGALVESVIATLAALAAHAQAPLGTALAAVADQPQSSGLAGTVRQLGEDSLVALLERTAAAHPQRPALVDGARTLSYTELWAEVSSIAGWLRAQGLGPGSTVGLGLPRGNRFVAAIFAVMAAGAAYIPLDAAYPDARAAKMFTTAEADAVLLEPGSSRDAALLAAAGTRVLVLDDAAAAGHAGAGAAQLHSGYTHADTAYLMFTSGSTGEPKGVSVPHRGLVNMLANHRREIFDPAIARVPDRPLVVAHTVSFAFDMSWEELFWLIEGHTVHVLDEALRRDAGQMVGYLREHRVDVINVTPSVASALLAEGLLAAGTHHPALVLLGGEAVGAEVWDALRADPVSEGYNLYGPTEYTINALGAGTGGSAVPVVGGPIENTEAYVLDSALRPVAEGAPGELYLAGDGLAHGYVGRAALTASRFIANPFGVPGTLMYRTGDVVSLDASGQLRFHGRSDAQVKIRGYRIEPGEVQAVLATDPRVGSAAVLARRMPQGHVALIGYVVPAAGADTEEARAGLLDAVRASARRELPDYMVPAHLVLIEKLPLTPNTKLDVAALPLPAPSAGRAPAGAAQIAVAEVFSTVLGVDSVHAEDDFYVLGGDSLKAMRAVSLLRARFETPLTVGALAAAPTVELLASKLSAGTDSSFDMVLPLAGGTGAGAPLYCFHPAGGLGWSYAGLAGHLGRGREIIALQSPRLSGPAPQDMAALRDCLVQAIRKRHPRGPYHLLGWSFGAHLAHMVAGALEKQGDEVLTLSLLDADAVTTNPVQGPAPDDAAALEQEALNFLLAGALRELPQWLTSPYRREEVLEFLAEAGGVWSHFASDKLEAILDSYAYSVGLLPGARYDRVHADTRLYTATISRHGVAASDPARAAAGWAEHSAGHFAQQLIEAGHYEMTSPAALGVIGPQLREDLARAEAEHAGN